MLTDIELAYILLFVSTLFLVEGIYYLVQDRREGNQRAVNRRLRLISTGTDRDAVLNRLRRNEMDPVSAVLARLFPWLEGLIREAGQTISLSRVLGLCAGLAAGVMAVLVLTTALPTYICIPAGLAVGLGLPVVVLHRLRQSRIQRMGLQLPDALDMMVRSLRAGHPVASAIGLVATEMADPAGSEFGIVVDEMTYGLDLHSALVNLADRVPHPDLRFFVVAVQIQHNTGGNLGEVLSNLSAVIRDRFTMKQKIKAITSQGRSAAFVIGMMPIASALLINWISKDYFGEVLGDPMFLPAILIAGGLILAGHIVIHKLVNFRF